METPTDDLLSPNYPAKDYHFNVDTSRPFGSVKEAIAIFGERLLVGEIYSPNPIRTTYNSPQPSRIKYSSSPNPTKDIDNHDHRPGLMDTLKKLVAELEETKVELKLLKERESETEIALASLNAELHKNMSKLASAEAAAAKSAAAATKTVSFDIGNNRNTDDVVVMREEERRRRELIRRKENSQTLAQILSFGKKERYFGGKKEKKKPIVPLVGDLFFKKKSVINYSS